MVCEHSYNILLCLESDEEFTGEKLKAKTLTFDDEYGSTEFSFVNKKCSSG